MNNLKKYVKDILEDIDKFLFSDDSTIELKEEKNVLIIKLKTNSIIFTINKTIVGDNTLDDTAIAACPIRRSYGERRTKRNEKIIDLYNQGGRQEDIASMLGVSQSTVSNVIRKYRKENI